MRFSIEAREGHLHAALYGRDTAEEMREFLLAVRTACQKHNQPKILIAVRQSRAVFKPEDYGLNGYVNELVTPACQIAVVGDTDEVNTAHEYIELVARQHGMNVRAFRAEQPALRWLRGDSISMRRYRFARIVIAGAPADQGVFTLWDGEEPVYHGRADDIRSALLDRYYQAPSSATHYSWEICADAVAREAELLREHERAFGRPPRYNAQAA